MCVAAIIHKPISLEYLKSMDDDNPHGAGVAWLENGALRFKRGLDAKAIFAMQEFGQLTYPYLLHFRWATHGDRIPELTHPFPTGPRAFAGELDGVAEQVLIHNGVWNAYSKWFDFVDASVSNETLAKMSDTAVAAYFYQELPDIGDEIPWAVASATLVDGVMHIRKHGGWSQWEGNEYSNLNWLPVQEFYKHHGYSRYRWNKSQYRGGGNWSSGGGWRWDGDEWNDWDDYYRARYGGETADGVDAVQSAAEALADAEGYTDDDTDLMQKLADEDAALTLAGEMDADFPIERIMADDCSLVSEDPETVNEWLGRHEEPKYHKCSTCPIYTRVENEFCGYCAAEMQKSKKEAA